MKNIIQILSDAGLEITDEQKKTIETGVNENYKTLAEFEIQSHRKETTFKHSMTQPSLHLKDLRAKTLMPSQKNVMSGKPKRRPQRKSGRQNLRTARKIMLQRLKRETSTMRWLRHCQVRNSHLSLLRQELSA